VCACVRACVCSVRACVCKLIGGYSLQVVRNGIPARIPARIPAHTCAYLHAMANLCTNQLMYAVDEAGQLIEAELAIIAQVLYNPWLFSLFLGSEGPISSRKF
jgi:hypothetical protein